MKKTSLLFIVALFSAIYILSSCDEKDNPTPANVQTVTIDASDYSKWIYFSFEEDTIVTISDFENSMDWDIGFHRYNLRINCGESGPGDGGTYATGLKYFDDVTIAPESGYSTNGFIDIAVDVSSFPPVMESVPGDSVLASWIKMTYNDNVPVYSYSNEVFVVKTAKGKYAKIWLKDYFNDNAESGHVTMKYSYQSDGSRNLE